MSACTAQHVIIVFTPYFGQHRDFGQVCFKPKEHGYPPPHTHTDTKEKNNIGNTPHTHTTYVCWNAMLNTFLFYGGEKTQPIVALTVSKLCKPFFSTGNYPGIPKRSTTTNNNTEES